VATGSEEDFKKIIDSNEFTLPALKVNAAIRLLEVVTDHATRIDYLKKVCSINDAALNSAVSSLRQLLAVEFAATNSKEEFNNLGVDQEVVRKHALALKDKPETLKAATEVLIGLRTFEDHEASNILVHIANAHGHNDPDDIAKILGNTPLTCDDIL
jgi:hypothetical protein